MRKRFQNAGKWGMVVKFINLTEGEKDKVEQIVTQAATVAKATSQSIGDTRVRRPSSAAHTLTDATQQHAAGLDSVA